MANILFVAEYKIVANTGGGVGRVGVTLARGFINKGHKVYYYAVDKATGHETGEDAVPQYYCADPDNVNSENNIKHLSGLLKMLDIAVIINHAGFSRKVQRLLSVAKDKNMLLITVHHNCIKCLYDNYQRIVTDSYHNRSWFSLIDNVVCWGFLRRYFKLRFSRDIKYVNQKSDKLVLLSDSFKKDLDFFTAGLDKKKIAAITNPASFSIETEVLKNKENRLLFVGTIKTNQKRVERLIDIWKAISKRFPEWSIDIVGDGPERVFLEDAFKANGLERYTFHGFADPRPFLKKAKIFLLTSDFEGLAMVLMESQAYGVVVVAFDSFAAIHDVIEANVNGVLVKPFDLGSYIYKLSVVMEDDGLRNSLAQEGLASVKKFDVDNIIFEWERLISNLKVGDKN